jgi:16S rRNA (cytosine967-C5)-methyltransferase
LPEENEKQVQQFLESNAGAQFTLLTDRKVLAHETGFDGFYVALLEKSDTAPES